MDHKVIIVGSGPAGLTAAIYAARASLRPLVLTGLQPGGQLTITTEVENFPGFPDGIQGPELMERVQRQAERFGAVVVPAEVTGVEIRTRGHVVAAGRESWTAPALIVSTGATARYLGIPGEEALKGRGVSACATCDGFFFRGKDVFVVGGGDSAMEEATYLSGICRSVTLVHRRRQFRASSYMVERATGRPNVRLELGQVPVEMIAGEDGLFRGLVTRSVESGEQRTLEGDGLFVAVGHSPNTAVLEGRIDLDGEGYVVTRPGSTRTSAEGVFACGDVQDRAYKQAVTAAGTGCMAALEAQRYLESI